MIEREFINQKTKEYYIKQYVRNKLSKVGGISSIRLKKIPLGEKIIIGSSKPSLIVGSRGASIRELTKELKVQFNLENPQIEINEVRDLYLDAQIVAEKITSALERFGSQRFKSVGHKVMENVMRSGALGVELIISGKIPSSRAKSWRFYHGYLKKCGDISVSGVRKAQASALLKSGIVGVKVSIMPPNLVLPDKIEILDEPQTIAEKIKIEDKGEKKSKKGSAKKTEEGEKSPKRKSASQAKKEKKVESGGEENVPPAGSAISKENQS